MRLAVFGSRSLHGAPVRAAIAQALVETGATHIVTAGEPDGVCREAQNVAREASIPATLHWLKPKERAAGKYHWRSVAVLSDCDEVLFVWDGHSKGTSNEMKLAEKRKVRVRVTTLKPSVETDAMQRLVMQMRAGLS
jgi:hypothetical protein